VTIDATLDAGSPHINFSVTVENTARNHRLRMLFPTGAERVTSARADTAFGIVSRPARREVPATIRNEAPVSSAPMISVVHAGDDRSGATVIGRGLMEYEVVPGEGSASIALTLIRAVGDLSRNDLATRPSGHAGPPVATPAAQCIGRYQFEIAFEPCGGAPASGRLYASARAVTIPPRVVAARKPGGAAETRRSFLRVERRSGDAVLSALKKAEDRDGIIVRLFNPGALEADVALTPGFAVTEAFAVNFLEAHQSALTIIGNTVSVRLKPHRIQTIELTR
jgi:alpha-mannosidase